MRNYIRPLLVLALAVVLGCAAIAATAPCPCRSTAWTTISVGGGHTLLPTDPESVLVDAPGVVLTVPNGDGDGDTFVVRAVYLCDVLYPVGASTGTVQIGAGESVTLRYHQGMATWFIIA